MVFRFLGQDILSNGFLSYYLGFENWIVRENLALIFCHPCTIMIGTKYLEQKVRITHTGESTCIARNGMCDFLDCHWWVENIVLGTNNA